MKLTNKFIIDILASNPEILKGFIEANNEAPEDCRLFDFSKYKKDQVVALTESSILRNSITLPNNYYLEYCYERTSNGGYWAVYGGFIQSNDMVSDDLHKTFATEEEAKKFFERYQKVAKNF